MEFQEDQTVQTDSDLQDETQKCKNNVTMLMEDMEEPLKNFKKNLYEANFREYLRIHSDTLDSIERAYTMLNESDDFLGELADRLIQKANEKMSVLSNKRKQEEFLLNQNMALVIYMNPAILEQNKRSGEAFVKVILEKWKENFPTTNLKYSTFEQINSGFTRKFCYITTAVCETLNKPDDCYELTLFRNYRDLYLQNQENGMEVIKEYYDIAPTIVKRINKRPDRKYIYDRLWREHLSQCLRCIEEGQNEKCLYLYEQMVIELTDMFFKQEGQIA